MVFSTQTPNGLVSLSKSPWPGSTWTSLWSGRGSGPQRRAAPWGGGAGGVGAAEGGEVATPPRADEATATAAPPADARAANEADGAVPAGAT